MGKVLDMKIRRDRDRDLLGSVSGNATTQVFAENEMWRKRGLIERSRTIAESKRAQQKGQTQ